jgi:hypothetical protein
LWIIEEIEVWKESTEESRERKVGIEGPWKMGDMYNS